MILISEIVREKSSAVMTGLGSVMEQENLWPVMMNGTKERGTTLAESWEMGTRCFGN